jgi:neutral amino acid transport system substrate-binding protein
MIGSELKPRRTSKWALMLAMVAAFPTMLLAGCEERNASNPNTSSPGASTPAANTNGGNSEKNLRLGILLSATGDVSSIAQPLPEAVRLLAKKVNECGGVNGGQVEVFFQDDQSKPDTGTAAMTKLVTTDRVAGVVGSFASGVSTAAASIATQNKVMIVSPGSTSPTLTEQAKKGVYQNFWARTAPPDTFQAPALAKLVFDKGIRKVATIAINNDYGVGFQKEFIATFKKLGGTVTNEAKPTRYDPKATTFDSEVKSAFEGKPEALVAIVYPDETGPLVIKAAYEQGLLNGVKVFFPDAGYSTAFPGQVGKNRDGKLILDGALGTVPGASGPFLKNFQEAWQKQVNKPLTPYLTQTWDAAALLVLAAQAAKVNTGVGIAGKIREVSAGPGKEVSDVCEGLKLLVKGEKINYQGASGNVDIDAYGDVVGSYDVWQIQPDGTYKTIGNVTAPGAASPTASPSN